MNKGIEEKLAEQISKEIDREILFSIIKEEVKDIVNILNRKAKIGNALDGMSNDIIDFDSLSREEINFIFNKKKGSH